MSGRTDLRSIWAVAPVDGRSNLRGALAGQCFNHLNDSQRRAMGREVDAVASADTTLLLLVWARARRGPLPPGASREDLQTAFPGWQIIEEQPYEGELPRPLRNVAPSWYRLARSRGERPAAVSECRSVRPWSRPRAS